MVGSRPLALLLVAALMAGCGGGEDSDGETSRVRSVADVLAMPPGADRQVIVEGRAYPIPDVGFALAGPQTAVLVTALPSEIAKLSDGEVVRVHGRIEEIGAGLARRIATEISGPGGLGLPRDVGALDELDLDRGAPFIANPSITGEDGPPGR